MVEGVFHGRDEVTRAVRSLAESSVPADAIHVHVVDASGRKREVAVEDEAGVLRGALMGAGLGAAAGLAIAVLGAAGAFGRLGVELLGLRTLVGVIRAVVAGAVVGVPLGAVLGLGRWRARKRIPEGVLDHGRVVVTVEGDDLQETARAVLRNAGAEHVDS